MDCKPKDTIMLRQWPINNKRTIKKPSKHGDQTNVNIRQKVKIVNPLRKDCTEDACTNFLTEIGELVEMDREKTNDKPLQPHKEPEQNVYNAHKACRSELERVKD